MAARCVPAVVLALADFTHYPLAGGTDTEILAWLDDHSRYLLRITAHRRVSGPAVVTEFRSAAAEHGIPASTLTDIQAVYRCWVAARCPAGGVRLPGDRRLPVVVADRPERAYA